MVQEPVPVTHLRRQGGAVWRGFLIQKPPDLLKILGLAKRILDQVLAGVSETIGESMS
jgi:hypothetical protein